MGSSAIGKEDTISAKTVNISHGGLCITTQSPLLVSEFIRLKLQVENTKINIPSFAEVRWVRPANGRYEIGVEFLV
jgi:Tfp pilus assembly protein PilZ